MDKNRELYELVTELMCHIRTINLDAGGNHSYHLTHKGYPIVTKIKEVLYEIQYKL